MCSLWPSGKALRQRGLHRDVCECPVASILIEPVLLVFASDEKVDPTVVVKVAQAAPFEFTGSSKRACRVTSVNPPLRLFSRSVSRIGKGATPLGE